MNIYADKHTHFVHDNINLVIFHLQIQLCLENGAFFRAVGFSIKE